eukprot:jgi/Undpi1/2525/HiC_scaffold_13.g05904.m1
MTPCPRWKAGPMTVVAGLVGFLAVFVPPAAASIGVSRAREEGGRPWQAVKDRKNSLGWLVPTSACLPRLAPDGDAADGRLPADCLRCVPRPLAGGAKHSEGWELEGFREGEELGGHGQGEGEGRREGGEDDFLASRERQKESRDVAPQGSGGVEQGWEGMFAEQDLLEKRGKAVKKGVGEPEVEIFRSKSQPELEPQSELKSSSEVNSEWFSDAQLELESHRESVSDSVAESESEEALAVAVRHNTGNDNGDNPVFGAGAFAALIMGAAAAAASSAMSQVLTGMSDAFSSSASSTAGEEWEWESASGATDVDAGAGDVTTDSRPDGGGAGGSRPKGRSQEMVDGGPDGRSHWGHEVQADVGRAVGRPEVRWSTGSGLRGGEGANAGGKSGGGGRGGGGEEYHVAKGDPMVAGRSVSRAMQASTRSPTVSPVAAPTPAPTAGTTSGSATPAPVGEVTTPAPSAAGTIDPAGATIQPSAGGSVSENATPAPSILSTATPAPDASLSPSATLSPADLASTVPSLLQTTNPSGTPAPTVVTLAPLGPGETHAPTTVMPTFSPLGEGETRAPSLTPSPTTREPSTSAPTDVSQTTPAPVGNTTSTDETLETTADAASSAVAVGVAATAAVATTNATTTTSGVENSATLGGADPGSISQRAPSATLGLLMIFQMQFVSLLRLLEANITKPFMKFLDNMKWMNLHFEVDISFFNCNDEDTRFAWANDDNGTWALNTFLVFALLCMLIFVHILLVSYLEAAWLARANAIHRHRLDFIRKQSAEEASAPFDGRSAAAYAKYIDAKNQDRDLYEQEKLSTERGICGAWTSGQSMLTWADKGQWGSKNDENVDLESRKFRIGFEPLFVDYTQRGTIYVFSDALTVGLMVYASVLKPEDSEDSDKLDLIYTGALLIQTLTIIFFIVPLYLDAFVTIMSTLCSKAAQMFKKKEKKSKTLIRGSCDETMWIFFALVRENFVAVSESASEEETENPMGRGSGFGKRPRQVKSTSAPTARRTHHVSSRFIDPHLMI